MKRTVMKHIAQIADMDYQSVRERCVGLDLDDLMLIEECLLSGGDFNNLVDVIAPPVDKLNAATGMLIGVVMGSVILGILASAVVVWAR